MECGLRSFTWPIVEFEWPEMELKETQSFTIHLPFCLLFVMCGMVSAPEEE